jgi:phosphorylase/glycogen(starch) synthase
MTQPQVLFEVSWEVCNMVGGIYTVLATKAEKMRDFYGDHYVVIGPDLARLGDSVPEFEEEIWDPMVLQAISVDQVRVRMGRWMIPGKPRCLLINYSDLYSHRDEILAEYWERNRLDSLFGEWDYCEPVMFGHAAGLVIERYYQAALAQRSLHAVAQCHEWLAGSTVLYLHNRVPEIGTVFTTHATVLGRAMAGADHDEHLYSKLTTVNAAEEARRLGVIAKHSMEFVAANAADVMATVSEVTACECASLLARQPDIIQPNALGEFFPDPALAAPEAAQRARRRLMEIASLVTGDCYDETKTTILVSSGRYEYFNKGLDVYLEAVAQAGAMPACSSQRLLAFVLAPAGHAGPRRSLMEGTADNRQPQWCTHDLREESTDPIGRKLRELGIANQPGDAVHVVFIPIYLNGRDPLIPEPYYKLLAGADLTVFPSFYEPWGYTPLESVGYGIPTVSSDRAGFGVWAQAQGGFEQTGVHVLARDGVHRDVAVHELASVITQFIALDPAARGQLAEASRRTGQSAQWQHFGKAYFQAHAEAAERAYGRQGALSKIKLADARKPVRLLHANGDGDVRFRPFTVVNEIPAELHALEDFARNLWWSWHPGAARLFSSLDEDLWHKTRYNPNVFLEMVKPAKLREAAASPGYLAKLEQVVSLYKSDRARNAGEPDIAFFCMEYGIVGYLHIYAGGLGVLAGDLLKTASDDNVPLCAVGLAYRSGYFHQVINSAGRQEIHPQALDFRDEAIEPLLGTDGLPITVTVASPSGPIHARAWRVGVGNINLYLLDTDFYGNSPADRAITRELYGSDTQNRLRQELVLGVGGFELLRKLGLQPKVYHLNEGHSAFVILARLAALMQEDNLKFHEALAFVRETTVFTTHTPVPAGHDRFPEAMVRPYLQPYESVLCKDWSYIMDMGCMPGQQDKREFNMTALSVRGASRINGVSKIHGRLSQAMFAGFYPGFHQQEVPVRSVTNGVHLRTWMAPSWQRVLDDHLGYDWASRTGDADFAGRIEALPLDVVWNTHCRLRSKLLDWLRGRLERGSAIHPPGSVQIPDDNAVIIGYARRIVPYKRADLLFADLVRLQKIVCGERRAIFVFAGKAPPGDHHAGDILAQLVELTRRSEFAGRILFVDGYDIDISRRLVSGCDVWLNTPERPLEASGTSGMKAGINGILNFAVDDGWWPEAWDGENGWMIPAPAAGMDQNEADRRLIFDMIEQEIFPNFYQRNSAGIPEKWCRMMLHAMATIIPGFSASRMLGDYSVQCYQPAIRRAQALRADNYRELFRLNECRRQLVEHWNSVVFTDAHITGIEGELSVVGRPLRVQVEIAHPGIEAEQLQPELVVKRRRSTIDEEVLEVHPMERISISGDMSRWSLEFAASSTGQHGLGVRLLPSPGLFDETPEPFFSCVRWL